MLCQQPANLGSALKVSLSLYEDGENYKAICEDICLCVNLIELHNSRSIESEHFNENAV